MTNTLKDINFFDLVLKFGEGSALQILCEIEKAAKIDNTDICRCPEERLSHAILFQDAA